MADAGLVPVGVVAPFGEWNPNLNRASADLGFEYSSEFCLTTTTCRSGRLSAGAEPPPAGPGPSDLPRQAGRGPRKPRGQMVDYFRPVIDLQVARQEPCFLYDHPERIAEYQRLLADVLSTATNAAGRSRP